MKRRWGLALVTTMLFIFSACGNNTGRNPNEGAGDGGNKVEKLAKISLFQSKVEIAESLENLASKYKKETGNEVEVWGSAGDSYITQLQTKLAANEGPTIFSVQQGVEAEKFASYFYDMTNETYAKYIVPNMALEIDGKVVGVPIGIEGFGLVYNKDLYDPSTVKDTESLIQSLEKFKADGINGLGLSQTAYFLIGHIINTPFALQKDPVAFIKKVNKGEVDLKEVPEFQEFSKLMEAIRAYTVNPVEVTYDRQMGDLASGKTAIVHQGNWSYSMLADYDDINIGLAPLPIAGNDKLEVGIPSGWVINNKASQEQITAANAFLEWLYTSETGKNTILNDFGFVPAVTTIKPTGLDPLSQQVYEASQSGNTIPRALNYFPQGIIINDLAPLASEFFLNPSITPEQFLDKLRDVWVKAAK
ncbi:sugar ABC transporter substrate-binding protein [Paenibacillus sp. FJAT-27812]|uniref:sugar ABC transporter substrate-binding protein n=1 Tax=Paenibacillus sp. FJAT-27812 TaxID=1684143 RepID=UPI0006A7BC50|nr:ABC transporter substrate-binding protein [Paenibacillus sp. FJAT-27812]